MNKAKKCFIILIGLAIVLIIVSIVFYRIDLHRAVQGEKPLFTISSISLDDGGSTDYRGLGYQIIIWHQLADEQPADHAYTVYEDGVESYYLIGFRNILDGPAIPLQKTIND
ncbi:hypothetical protein [Candidatus Soleaferrea massiliensis]|uniref:hypothetical protein n=1 Tax=Candidatus Soleaferrea massiliensis TaxID=1470354 RepID=UPI000693A44E|nr:hypothetical protein [Candidatus Soleaferrea massiliensis]